MGCDIHLYTERQQVINSKQAWVSVDHWKINPYFVSADEQDGERQYDHVAVYRNRNYDLFTALAGVRDYSDKAPKLDEPRGMPDDASPQTQAEYERWEGDGHSHSHATLYELIQWQAQNTTTTYSGLVSPDTAKMLDEHGVLPQSWCQGTSDRTWVQREWSAPATPMAPLIEALEARAREEFWIFDKTAPIPEEQQKQIRVVFWFDN